MACGATILTERHRQTPAFLTCLPHSRRYPQTAGVPALHLAIDQPRISCLLYPGNKYTRILTMTEKADRNPLLDINFRIPLDAIRAEASREGAASDVQPPFPFLDERSPDPGGR